MMRLKDKTFSDKIKDKKVKREIHVVRFYFSS